MRKNRRYIIGFILLLLAAAAWIFLGPATAFDEKTKYLYIHSDNSTQEAVQQSLQKDHIIKNKWAFDLLANMMSYWKKIKPGRYEIPRGDNLINIIRRLRNGNQSPVKLVINKLRTREDLATLLGNNFECSAADILSFFSSNDSLRKFGLDSNTAMTVVIPNTYLIYWNSTTSKLFRRLYSEKEKFWTDERVNKAKKLGLTNDEVYTLASIIEEETNKEHDKPLIASTYLNRMKSGMALGADPTIKFALKDFSIKRIMIGHIERSASSPFNTYRRAGLPPGPICTPSVTTIDAVLNAPETKYLFFCARPDFSGLHAFAASDREHAANAKRYHQFLDSLHLGN